MNNNYKLEINPDNFEYLYEAAFVAKASNFFKAPVKSPHGYMAAKRILKAFDLLDEEKILNFLNTYSNQPNLDEYAKTLFNLIIAESGCDFFNDLSFDELYFYHCYNYEVSFFYGKSLSSKIDFSNKSILDIGGSSGGLVSGILESFPSAKATVFDTFSACKAGKKNNTNINFITGDFFETRLEGNYDYVILSNIIHDWEDDKAQVLLNNISHLFKKKTLLIIHEDVLIDNSDGFLYGLRLSTNFRGANQRTVEDISLLLNKAYKDIKLEQTHIFSPLTALIYSLKP